MTRQEGSFDHIVAIHPIAIMTLEVPFEGRGDLKLEVILQGWREWGSLGQAAKLQPTPKSIVGNGDSYISSSHDLIIKGFK